MPPTKDDPLGGDGQDGGAGGLLAKSPPSPPYPLSPSKTLIRENHRELLPRQDFPCPMVSRQGLRRTAFFLHAGGHVTSSTPVSVPNSSPLVIRFLPFCHAAGRPADEGRSARPDGLRSSRQSFLRDGWGRGGEETASKRKTVRDARFLLFAMLPGDWRTRDGLRDQTAYDPPGKVFCGMDGGRGGKEGGFFPKKPPSFPPHTPPLPSNRLRLLP